MIHSARGSKAGTATVPLESFERDLEADVASHLQKLVVRAENVTGAAFGGCASALMHSVKSCEVSLVESMEMKAVQCRSLPIVLHIC